MLSYLSKFVLQMLPTIAATVIGAYIVSTWINPKDAKIAAGAPRQQAAKVAYPVGQPAQPKAAHSTETAVDATEEQPGNAASAPDSIRIIPIVRQASPAQVTAVATPVSAPPATAETTTVDQPRDATTLARTAIQRQRGGTEIPRGIDEPVRANAPGSPQQTRAAGDAQPSAVATVAPPLPPAITIAPLRAPQAEAADGLSSERPTPPGEIPAVRSPLSLHASHRVPESPSPADDFLNATRSFFRALTPQ